MEEAAEQTIQEANNTDNHTPQQDDYLKYIDAILPSIANNVLGKTESEKQEEKEQAPEKPDSQPQKEYVDRDFVENAIVNAMAQMPAFMEKYNRIKSATDVNIPEEFSDVIKNIPKEYGVLVLDACIKANQRQQPPQTKIGSGTPAINERSVDQLSSEEKVALFRKITGIAKL